MYIDQYLHHPISHSFTIVVVGFMLTKDNKNMKFSKTMGKEEQYSMSLFD